MSIDAVEGKTHRTYMTNKLFVSFIHNGFWDKISKYLMIFQCWISSWSDIQISTSLRYVNILKVDMSGFWNIFFESLNMLTLLTSMITFMIMSRMRITSQYIQISIPLLCNIFKYPCYCYVINLNIHTAHSQLS